ncbi:hypothetical protein [Lysobacter enzymogenes]|nr:hypothetical protein [Lysobacter enzymogenes]QQP96407.1 hypothetical protein JHW38_24955 [Lysobacter enzymogenes]
MATALAAATAAAKALMSASMPRSLAHLSAVIAANAGIRGVAATRL